LLSDLDSSFFSSVLLSDLLSDFDSDFASLLFSDEDDEELLLSDEEDELDEDELLDEFDDELVVCVDELFVEVEEVGGGVDAAELAAVLAKKPKKMLLNLQPLMLPEKLHYSLLEKPPVMRPAILLAELFVELLHLSDNLIVDISILLPESKLV